MAIVFVKTNWRPISNPNSLARKIRYESRSVVPRPFAEGLIAVSVVTNHQSRGAKTHTSSHFLVSSLGYLIKMMQSGVLTFTKIWIIEAEKPNKRTSRDEPRWIGTKLTGEMRRGAPPLITLA